jgi:hypothetical protein
MPDIRDDHRHAGHQHGTPGRGRRDAQGDVGVVPPRPFLAHAAQVEHAVVDTDGEADEEHHRARRGVQVHPMTDQGQEAVGRQERGERQPDREDGGQQRTERHQQDAQGQRHRRPLSALEVLADRVVEPLVGRAVAELLDLDARMLVERGGNGVLERLHAVAGRHRVSGHRDLHQRRVPVCGDETVLEGVSHVGHEPGALQPFQQVPDRGPGGGCGHRAGAGDEEQLAGRDLEPGVIEDLHRPGGVTLRVLVLAHLLLARHRPEHRRQHHEDDPPDDGDRAVPHAPPAHGGCEVSLDARTVCHGQEHPPRRLHPAGPNVPKAVATVMESQGGARPSEPG